VPVPAPRAPRPRASRPGAAAAATPPGQTLPPAPRPQGTRWFLWGERVGTALPHPAARPFPRRAVLRRTDAPGAWDAAGRPEGAPPLPGPAVTRPVLTRGDLTRVTGPVAPGGGAAWARDDAELRFADDGGLRVGDGGGALFPRPVLVGGAASETREERALREGDARELWAPRPASRGASADGGSGWGWSAAPRTLGADGALGWGASPEAALELGVRVQGVDFSVAEAQVAERMRKIRAAGEEWTIPLTK